jgi:hypothetical protein
VAADNSTCPGSTQPLKMSTRILLGVKAAGITKSGSINFPKPSESHMPLMEVLYLFYTRFRGVKVYSKNLLLQGSNLNHFRETLCNNLQEKI